MAIVVSLVVFLLGMAALCGAIAIWTVLNDRPAPGTFAPAVEARALPFQVTAHPPAEFRPAVPFDMAQTSMMVMSPRLHHRRMVPPGVQRLPPPLPRNTVRGTPIPGRDEDVDDDYTEVELDDGVTIIRYPRAAARR